MEAQMRRRESDPIALLSTFLDPEIQRREVDAWCELDFPITAELSHPREIWPGSAGQFASYPLDVGMALMEFRQLERFGLTGEDGQAVSSCRGAAEDVVEAVALLALSREAATKKNPWPLVPEIMIRFSK
jgi:hypothetical protein